MGTINTRISYLYRDADNYKMQNSCVIMGVITETQIAEIISCLDCGEYFIPRQVGLPEKRFDRFDEEADHCWFELNADGFEVTEDVSNIDMTVGQLLELFHRAKNNWHDEVPLGGDESVAQPNKCESRANEYCPGKFQYHER